MVETAVSVLEELHNNTKDTMTLVIICMIPDCLYNTSKVVDVELAERTLDKHLVAAHIEILDKLIDLYINVLNMDLYELVGPPKTLCQMGHFSPRCAGWWCPNSVTSPRYRHCARSRRRKRRVLAT